MTNNVLVIVAHADDEVLGCGGTIAKHVISGDKVDVVFMTNGVSSRSKVSSNEILLRKEASKKAADCLGVSSITQLDFPDNKMDAMPLLDIIKQVETLIQKFKPKIVYTHHIGDLNLDHQITHKAVLTASRPMPNFCVKEIYCFEVLSSTEWQTPGYNPFFPNLFIDITDHMDQKKEALNHYSMEMRPEPHSRSHENAVRLNSIRGNTVGIAYAEAFTICRIIK